MVASLVLMVFYLLLMIRQIAGYRVPCGEKKRSLLLLSLLVAVMHAFLLYQWIVRPFGLDLNIVNLFSMCSWLVVVGLCVLMLFRPVELSVIIAFPIAALSIFLVILFPQMDVVRSVGDRVVLFHIVISTLAFCMLCLASLMAIILAIHERLLRYKHFKLLDCFPPMQLMEQLLFQLVSLGWGFLTMTLLTSLYCYSSLLMMPNVLLKLLMAIFSWLIFSIVMFGRVFYGWRGSKVIYGTLFGVSLLVLVYFGSKIILESIYV